MNKPYSLDNLFRRLWTKAVGTPDYDKEEWKELEWLLWTLVPAWAVVQLFQQVPVEALPGSMLDCLQYKFQGLECYLQNLKAGISDPCLSSREQAEREIRAHEVESLIRELRPLVPSVPPSLAPRPVGAITPEFLRDCALIQLEEWEMYMLGHVRASEDPTRTAAERAEQHIRADVMESMIRDYKELLFPPPED